MLHLVFKVSPGNLEKPEFNFLYKQKFILKSPVDKPGIYSQLCPLENFRYPGKPDKIENPRKDLDKFPFTFIVDYLVNFFISWLIY